MSTNEETADLAPVLLRVFERVVREELRAHLREVLPKPEANERFNKPELLKVDQVAAELQVKRTTVRAWIRSGALKATLLGPAGKRREYRVRRTDLEAFVSGGTGSDTPDAEAQVSRILGVGTRRRHG